MHKFLFFEFSGFTFRGRTVEDLEKLIESSLNIQCFCDKIHSKVFKIQKSLEEVKFELLGYYEICYNF